MSPRVALSIALPGMSGEGSICRENLIVIESIVPLYSQMVIHLIWSASNAIKCYPISECGLSKFRDSYRVLNQASIPTPTNELIHCTVDTRKQTHARSARLRIGCVSRLRPNKIPAMIQQMALASISEEARRRERPKIVSLRCCRYLMNHAFIVFPSLFVNLWWLSSRCYK
jgi:hypothetical protein